MSGLDAEFLKGLLEEEARQPRRGGGGKKADPTEDRSLVVWMKLHHHICTKDCPHRVDTSNPTRPFIGDPNSPDSLATIGSACWNPNCLDPRNKETDMGANIVAEVKGQWICRYCYLDGYLL